MRHRVKLVLILNSLFALQQAVANPPALIAPPRERNDSIRALLEYLWPLLSSAKRPGRVYYRAICTPDDHSYPLEFPEIDVRQRSNAETDLAVVRSIFRRDHDVTVTEDRTGVVRVRIGDVPETVLHTFIPELSFDALNQ